MPKRAKTLETPQIEELLEVARITSSVPESAELRILLSFLGGLRAAEIANLPVAAMTTVQGYPAETINVVGKRRKSRTVPMHPRIREALHRFLRLYPEARYISVSRRTRKKPPQKMSANSVTTWFHRLYGLSGFEGCSSHSGRRTFATVLARTCGAHNRSLVDVQHLLGHAQLSTTQAYIEASDNVRALVESLGSSGSDVYIPPAHRGPRAHRAHRPTNLIERAVLQ